MPWTAKLARPLMLVDGTQVLTFRDALEALMRHFAGTDPNAIEPAIGLLVKADVTRKANDIDQASRQFETLLRQRHLMT